MRPAKGAAMARKQPKRADKFDAMAERTFDRAMKHGDARRWIAEIAAWGRRVVLQEREACARLAEDDANPHRSVNIAEAIRGRKP